MVASARPRRRGWEKEGEREGSGAPPAPPGAAATRGGKGGRRGREEGRGGERERRVNSWSPSYNH